jgi:hypothetical protein
MGQHTRAEALLSYHLPIMQLDSVGDVIAVRRLSLANDPARCASPKRLAQVQNDCFSFPPSGHTCCPLRLTGACFSEVVESNLIAVANALPFSAPPKDTLDVEGIEDGVDLCKRSLRSS